MDCCRTYLVGFADGFDADLHAVELVEAIEDAKHVHPIFGGEVAELRNHVVGVARVAHRVGAADQHLKADVGNRFPQRAEPLPGVLVEKPVRDIKGRAAPALEGEAARVA